jgi:zinc transport system substrate-binding protein
MRRWLALALVLLLALPARAATETGPRVVVSIKPIHALASAVMAGVGKPTLLVAGGQSPHTYGLKPSDARALNEAQLVFWVGPMIESFLIRPLASLDPSVHVVTLIEEPRLTRYPVRAVGAPEAKSAPETARVPIAALDGHIWLDPQNAMVIVTRMREELAGLDPAHAGTYAENATATLARLTVLDHALSARLAPLREKPFIVFHDAYQYFERHYALAGIGAIALNPELQPGARTLKALRSRLVEQGALCAFAEPQFEPKLLGAITRGTETRLGTLDPEGAMLEPGADLYFILLNNLADSLAGCLEAAEAVR